MAFKWFARSEPGADVSLELLREHAKDQIALVAPSFLPLEVVNALSCGGVALAGVESAVRLLADADLIYAQVDDDLLVSAARIASDDGVALYDAAFVALASLLDAELVTADRRQASTTACRVRLVV